MTTLGDGGGRYRIPERMSLEGVRTSVDSGGCEDERRLNLSA